MRGFIRSALLVFLCIAAVHTSRAQIPAASTAAAASLSDIAVMQGDQQRSRQLSPDERARAIKLFDQAFALHQAGDFEAAKLGFERGLGIDPANGLANYYLGDILARRADTNAARVRYERALFFDPDSAEGLKSQIALKKIEADVAKAKADIAWSRKYTLQSVIDRKQQYPGILQKYIVEQEQRLRKDPNNFFAIMYKVQAQISIGQYEEAIRDLSRPIPDSVRPGAISYNLGLANLMSGRFDQAIIAFTRGLQFDSYIEEQVVWLHVARSRAGRPDAAEFQNNAGRVGATHQLRPIVDFYLGKVAADELMTMAESHTDSYRWRETTCRFAFFVGEHEFVRGNQGEARKHLETTRVFCWPTEVESHAAEQNLKRIQGSSR